MKRWGKWQVWAGGECPIAAATFVEVEFDDGLRLQRSADTLFWDYDRSDWDRIRRYRVRQ